MLSFASLPLASRWTLRLAAGALLGTLACGGDDGGSSPGAGQDASANNKPDAKAGSGGQDAGSTQPPPVPKTDSGTTPATNPTLASLAGRYLLRWDTFGTGTAGLTSIRSRVSLLFVTELVPDGDHLKATERLCNQTATQTCLKGCTSASTTVSQGTIQNFFYKTMFNRDYTLSSDGTTINAGSNIIALGYDGTGDLPTSDKDTSVWDSDPSMPDREGILTSLDIEGIAPLGSSIMCDVYGVEKFITTWSGMLGGSASAPTFPTAEMQLIFDPATAASRLHSTNSLCDAAGDSPNDKAVVRMVRYGDSDGDKFWDCYADSVFDQQLPPDPVTSM